VEALIKEILAEKEYLAGETVQTVYFGGGTPSLLPPSDIDALLTAIRLQFPVSPEAEITLEANPDDITQERLQAWKDSGINRLSIGVQSFIEEELRWMNRAHNSIQARQGLELALKSFNNLTMDLIYGSPLLTNEGWQQNIDTALSLGVPHLSCYALTVEEKTPLYKLISNRKAPDVDSDKQAAQFMHLMKTLRAKGYEHYEVSNFAKPGHRSRHNSAYWKGSHYLGLGPAAHSYNGVERRWNLPNNAAYISGLQTGIPPREHELLTGTQRLNEYIMISLRTGEGLDLERLSREWGSPVKIRVEKDLEKYIRKGQVMISGTAVRLTDEGMLLADGIASDLFT
jgi:oxygen-independent coproporphyrinogen-3 oxidase